MYCVIEGFESATFLGLAKFDNAIFPEHERANFRSATFYYAGFADAVFSGIAIFIGSSFSEGAIFQSATFSGGANFGGATFSGGAAFEGATFSGEANFDGATFSGRAYFDGATFGKRSSFVNAKMKGETSFEGAKFVKKPPRFFGAKLHEGTVWRGIDWPKPKKASEAGPFLDAYERLMLEMDRLKKHEDELDFFALELQSRRVMLGPWWGLPIAIYGMVSDYGRSYARPFLWLLAVAAIGALLLLFSDALHVEKSFGLSAANTLNGFGFRKDIIDLSDIKRLPAWLDVVSALQTIFGTILLLLFGLGIRNKFRMK